MKESQNVRYALITGAGSGLGRAFCLRFAKENWHVIAADINLENAQQTINLVQGEHGTGQAEQLDVTNIDAWRTLCEKIQTELPRLDLVVNNAGVCSSGELGQGSLDTYLQTIDVNLNGVIYGCHTTIPMLKESKGHLVNIASIFGVVPPPTTGAYNLSKAAVITLSETLLGELLPYEVGVTVVIPGFFKTSLLDNAQFETEAHLQTATHLMQKASITKEDVVEETLQAIQKNSFYVVMGKKPRWYWRFKRLAPRAVVQRIASRYRDKMTCQNESN